MGNNDINLVSCYHITQENYKLNFLSDDSQKREYIFEVETFAATTTDAICPQMRYL